MSIGENIKKIRMAAEMTQREFAEVAGVTNKAVSMWESGLREPRMGALQKISTYFGIPKSEIIDGVTLSVQASGSVPIPIYKGICSIEDIEMCENIIAYEPVPAEYLDQTGRYFYLVAEGDAMDPIISDGDLVLVKFGASVLSGDYAVVSLGMEEQAGIKKIITDGSSIKLVCENPYYPKRAFKGEAARQIRVMGAVKRIVRNFY